MSTVKEIKIPLEGMIKVQILSTGYPQSIAGKVFKYDTDGNLLGEAGVFTTASPMIELGLATNIESMVFFIAGVVNHHNDDPPTSYEVTVSVYQDKLEVESEVPSEGGSGEISDNNKGFTYSFKIIKEES